MYEDLKVYRGSTFDCSISLVDRKRNTFLLSDGDKLIFGIKKNLSVDPETGKIDIDKVEGRTPTSDRDRMNKVMQEIGVLEAEFEKVPITVLKEHLAENYDMSEEKVDSILKNLKSKGLIYEPRNGLVNRLDNK